MDLFKLMGTIVINGGEKAKAEIAEVSETAEQTQGEVSGSFEGIKKAAGRFLTGAAIAKFGQTCIQAAADANAAESQFSQVFGDLEGNARKSLTGISDEAGISENRLKGSFTQIAAFAKTTGMDTESALGLSERAMIAVADSAAFYDRSIEDTTESLQSFLKGNYENDAALGLSCTETTRNAAANELYGKSFQKLSEDQKQLTLLKMVEDANKASGAIGQAARESETWSNVTGNLKQSFTDLMAVLGSNVLPVATKVVTGLAGAVQGLTDKTKEAIEWAKEHKTAMTYIGIAVGTLAAAIGAYNIAINAATIATKLHTAWTTVATTVTTAFGSVLAFLTSPVTLVVAAIGALIAIGVALYKNWDTVKAACSKLGEHLKKIWQNIKETISAAWETIKNVVKVGIMFIVELVKAAFSLITLPFRMIWENCKDIIKKAWNAIKTEVTKALNAVKDKVSSVFNAVKSKVQTVWNSIKSVISTVVNAVKSKVSSVFNSVKNTVSRIMNSIKSKISVVWNSVKSTVSGAVNNVKSKISSGLNGAKSTVTSVLNGIKSKFTSIFNSVKTIVSNAIDKIKSKFNFNWKLPKLKLPHFKIAGEFKLNPPSVPKFSIDWYKKAMDNPMILNDPTIFGYNAATGKFLGGGEAGSEMVGGTNTIMGMISAAVAEQNSGLLCVLQKILSAILAMTDAMGESLKEAIDGTSLEVNRREFARLVKEVG